MSLGPIQILAIEFDSIDRFRGRILDELDELIPVSAVRKPDSLQSYLINRDCVDNSASPYSTRTSGADKGLGRLPQVASRGQGPGADRSGVPPKPAVETALIAS